MAVNFTVDHLDVEDDLTILVKRWKMDPDNQKTCQYHWQTAWLDRGNPDVEPKDWKLAVTIYRSTAKKWMVNVDMQMQYCSGLLKGLLTIKYESGDPVCGRKNWRKWPGMGIAMDLGSDGVFAVHADELLGFP